MEALLLLVAPPVRRQALGLRACNGDRVFLEAAAKSEDKDDRDRFLRLGGGETLKREWDDLGVVSAVAG